MPEGQETYVTARVLGTFGYFDPEYTSVSIYLFINSKFIFQSSSFAQSKWFPLWTMRYFIGLVIFYPYLVKPFIIFLKTCPLIAPLILLSKFHFSALLFPTKQTTSLYFESFNSKNCLIINKTLRHFFHHKLAIEEWQLENTDIILLWQQTGKLTLQSDVYAFGVVLLELLTGRRAVDLNQGPNDQNLVLQVTKLSINLWNLLLILDVWS